MRQAAFSLPFSIFTEAWLARSAIALQSPNGLAAAPAVIRQAAHRPFARFFQLPEQQQQKDRDENNHHQDEQSKNINFDCNRSSHAVNAVHQTGTTAAALITKQLTDRF